MVSEIVIRRFGWLGSEKIIEEDGQSMGLEEEAARTREKGR